MKEAISTKTESPSLSLIEKICYRRKFRNVATDWGIEYEKLAKDCYFIQNSKTHSNFTIRKSGLVINPKWSYIGTSPDSIVGCSCCGERCLQIKCSQSDRDNYIIDILGQKSFHLYYQEDRTIFLKRDHPYFYQVQTQMLVRDLQFCDLFVWTNCDSLQIIIANDEDIQAEIIKKAKPIFARYFYQSLPRSTLQKQIKKMILT